MRNLSVINPCKNRLFLHDCLLRSHTTAVQREPPSLPPAMFCLGTSHSCLLAVNTIIVKPKSRSGFSPRSFKMETIPPGLSKIGEADKWKHKQQCSMHKLYTVTKKTSTTVAKVCRAYRNAVWGPLGANKESTVRLFSPALPHPHIISWKIPDICCNFFALWYRQAFNIQMPLDPATQPPLDSLFFPIGPQPAARQQIPPTRSGSKGSILSGRLAKEVTQEIPNKTLPVHCATPLFVCLLVFRSPPFFRRSLSPLLSPFWNTEGDI